MIYSVNGSLTYIDTIIFAGRGSLRTISADEYRHEVDAAVEAAIAIGLAVNEYVAPEHRG